MERLRYENLGTTISISLPMAENYEGFEVVARYKQAEFENLRVDEKRKYSISMWLHKNAIAYDFKIQNRGIDEINILSTPRRVKFDIINIINQMLENKIIDKYIDNFNFVQNKFEIGLELEEIDIAEYEEE